MANNGLNFNLKPLTLAELIAEEALLDRRGGYAPTSPARPAAAPAPMAKWPRQNAAPSERLEKPLINPFLQRFWSNGHGDKKQRKTRWTEERFIAEAARATQEHIENRNKKGPENNTVTVARTSIFQNPELGSRHGDEDHKRIAEVFLYRYGELTNHYVAQILKGQRQVNDSNRHKIEVWCGSYQFQDQNKTLFYFEHTVRHLRELVGEEAWDNSSTIEKKKVLIGLFREAPTTICRAAFAMEANTIDFNMMFRAEDNGRRESQKFTISKFITLALAVWRCCVIVKNNALLFDIWKR